VRHPGAMAHETPARPGGVGHYLRCRQPSHTPGDADAATSGACNRPGHGRCPFHHQLWPGSQNTRRRSLPSSATTVTRRQVPRPAPKRVLAADLAADMERRERPGFSPNGAWRGRTRLTPRPPPGRDPPVLRRRHFQPRWAAAMLPRRPAAPTGPELQHNEGT